MIGLVVTGVLGGTAASAVAVGVLGRAVVLLPPETGLIRSTMLQPARAVVLLPPEIGLIRSTRLLVPQPAAMSLLHPVVISPVKTIPVVKVPRLVARDVKVPHLAAPVVRVPPLAVPVVRAPRLAAPDVKVVLATNVIIDMRTVEEVADSLVNDEDLEMDPGDKLF